MPLERLTVFWRRWRGAIIGTTAVMLGCRIGDVFNFLYSILLGRWLGNGEFGQASALLNAVAIPAAAIGVLVCRETVWRTEAHQQTQLSRFVWRWFWWSLAAGALCALIIICCNSYVGTILRYSHPAVGYGLAALVVLTLVRPFWQSVLLGQERFLLISFGPPLEGFMRLAFTMLLLYYLHAGLQGVVAAQVMTGIVMLAYGMVLGIPSARARRAPPPSPSATPPCSVSNNRTPFYSLATSLVMVTALTLLMSTDVIVANFVFPGPIADGYAGVAILGKIVLYVPESMAVILLPSFLRDDAYGRSSTRYVLAAIGIAAAGALTLTIVYAIWGTAILTLYRREFAAYAHLLPWYAAAMGGVAVCRMIGTQAMARSRLAPGLALLAVAGLQVLGFYCFRRTIDQTAYVLAATSFLAALVSISTAVIGRRNCREKPAVATAGCQ